MKRRTEQELTEWLAECITKDLTPSQVEGVACAVEAYLFLRGQHLSESASVRAIRSAILGSPDTKSPLETQL